MSIKQCYILRVYKQSGDKSTQTGLCGYHRHKGLLTKLDIHLKLTVTYFY